MSPRTRSAALLAGLLVLLLAAVVQPAFAASFVVTTATDGAGICPGVNCNLRTAIFAANITPGADTISFDSTVFSSAQTITLVAALPAITESVDIVGPGAANLTISGNNLYRVFQVNSGATVTISGMTITNGTGDFGGGINNSGTLTLSNTTVRNSSATIAGGGIHNNFGTLTLNNSTLSGNTANNGGGGIYNLGGAATVTNSVLVNNTTTTQAGGGIWNASGGQATFNNSTLSGNAAPIGGGVYNGGTSTLNLNNTMVANSVSGGDCVLGGGTLNAQNSLVEGGLGCVNGTNTNNLTGDPALNGDLTLTSTSIAINAGDNSLIPGGVTTDLAGLARIQNTTVDMGAYESAFMPFVPSVTISPASANVSEGDNTNFTVTRSGFTANWTSALTVTVNVTLGTDTVDADYDLSGGSISGQSGSVTVSIPAGQASVDVSFAAADDVDAEADNTLTMTLVDGAAYDLGATTSSTMTIPANDLVVTNTSDSGDGSLRQAITNANAFASNDTITFTAGANGPITLASALPNLANNGTLTITGNGAANTIISGSNAVRVFNMASSANVTLNSLTVTQGSASGNFGGGIRNEGTLTVNNSTISNNSAGASGGGIFSNSGKTLTITNSVISGNSATSGGGISNRGTLTVNNSIISGNAATEDGGGIYNLGGTLTVNNSTLSGNAATEDGGGIFSLDFGGIVNLRNSIVANSTSGGDCVSVLSSVVNAQHSLIEDGLTCVNGTNTANLTGDPALNGDLTLTSTSIAINAGNNALIPSGVTTDLAGNARTQEGTVDMGAYESAFTPFVPSVTISPASANVAEGSNANITLTRNGAAANWASALVVTVNVGLGTGTVASDYTLSGGSISGQSGSVTVSIPAGQASVDVNFAAADDVDAEANNTLTMTLVDGAAYDLGATASSTLTVPANDLVVTNTNDSGDGSLRQAITNANAFSSNDTITFTAAANGTITLASALPDLANNGTLTITGNGAANTIISGNNAVRGFQVASNANVTLNSLTVTQGSAGGNFGGGIRNEGTLTVNNSTISNNSTSGNGGGIFSNVGKTLTITNSVISGNSATSGGGIFSFIDATLTVANSIISGNSVSGDGSFGSGRGGGILAHGALTVTNSTISGNSATINGGGITSNDSTLTLTNSTISGNSATINGGGIYSEGSNASLNLRNSIIANSVSGGDCVRGGGTINARNSLIESGLTCVNGTNTNNLTGDPALNGDLTLTSTSIAINAGDNSLIPSGVTTDLAGNARTQEGTVDMGAYESAFTAPIPVVTISATDASGSEAGPDAITFTVTRSGASTVNALSVNYTIGGSATNGTDYTPTLTGTVSIPAAQASVTITSTPVDDSIAEGSETVELTLTADAAYTLGTPSSASATISDNDTAGITLTESAGSTAVTEGGATDTFTVVLTSQPTADVVITVTPNAQVNASPTPLTFTAANWNTAQTVTVSAVDDAVVEGAHSGQVSFSVASSDAKYDGFAVFPVTVSITDNDVAGVTVTPTSGLTTTEAGGTAQFTVVLTSQPTADVVITVASSNTAEGTVSPGTLTFTAADWNTAQTVTVTGVDDNVKDTDIAYNVTLSAASSDSNYDGIAIASVSLTNADNEIAGVLIDPVNGLVTTEAGGTATFTAVLRSQPVADVVVTVTADDPTEVSAAPTTLTFTPANWNAQQVVTLTGQDDDVADGNVISSVSFSVASTDSFYNGVGMPIVTVTSTDDDTVGVTVTPTSGLTTTEAGGTATFDVVLTSQPTGDVTMGVSSDNTAEGTVDPASLTFTSANWNVAQTVTITGVDDDIADGDVPYTIVLAAATSTDTGYNGLNPADVSVTNHDDDVAGLTFAPGSLTLAEGASGAMDFSLNTTPSATPVSVTLTFDSTALTVNGVGSPVVLDFSDTTPVSLTVESLVSAVLNTNRTVVITAAVTSSTASEYPTTMTTTADVLITENVVVATPPPPPPVPTCEAHNFDEGGVVRSSVSDALGYAINCRIMYQNGASTTWLGSDMYSSGNLGVPGLMELGVQQAIDIFSPSGVTYFQGGAVFCLRGSGSLIWLAASNSPRRAEIIGSYTVPEFPGFTCATLFEPGTLVLVSENPVAE